MLRQILCQVKKHPSLIPLFIFFGAALYVMCLALFNPDVSWGGKNNLKPWNKLGPNEQYKFYSVNVGYSKLKKEGPDFSMKCFPLKLLRMKGFQKPSAQFPT